MQGYRFFFLITLLIKIFNSYSYENPFVIVVPSYNNSKWVNRNLDSIFEQQYSNYRVIYIDDCSSDQTGNLVKSYINNHNVHNKVLLIQNSQRCLALENLYKSGYLCDDGEIIIVLDGDDWFADNKVLQHINKEYQDLNTWLTYGSLAMVHLKDGKEFLEIPNINLPLPHDFFKDSIRKKLTITCRFCPGHPFTCYAWLFKKIKLKDLFVEGKYSPMAYDSALRFPLIEMAQGHIKFIDRILYHLNRMAIHDGNVNSSLLWKCIRHFALKTPYDSLQETKSNELSSNSYTIDIIVLSDQDSKKLNECISALQNKIIGNKIIHIISESKIDLQSKNSHEKFFSTDNNTINQIIIQLLEESKNDFVFILHDKYGLDTEINIEQCINILNKTYAFGFYVNLNKENFQKTIQAPLNHVQDSFYAWQFLWQQKSLSQYCQNNKQFKLNYPFTCYGALYRKKNIQDKLFQMPPCKNIKEFKSHWKLCSKEILDEIGIIELKGL